jgi:hypothetical protein
MPRQAPDGGEPPFGRRFCPYIFSTSRMFTAAARAHPAYV